MSGRDLWQAHWRLALSLVICFSTPAQTTGARPGSAQADVMCAAPRTHMHANMHAPLGLFAVWCMMALRVAHGQAAAQFVPTDLSSNITSRLVFRQEGLANFWKDSQINSVVIRDRVVLDEDYWRDQFQSTGGTAVLSQDNGLEFVITSDKASQVTPELNFSLMANAMLVGSGGRLVFQDITLLDFAHTSMYEYSETQPYRNLGVGWPLWPTVAMAPGARVELVNVSTAYQNPAVTDTCEQYAERVVFALQQQYGRNVRALNTTAFGMTGPVQVRVVVYNGSDNSTLGNATAVIENATFNCVPRIFPSSQGAGGLAPGVLAAAIAVPVVVVVAAAVFLWLWLRRRRQRRNLQQPAKVNGVIELGHSGGASGSNYTSGSGHHQPQGMMLSADKVPELPGALLASQNAYGAPYYLASSSSAATSSASVLPHTWSGSAPGYMASGNMVPAGPSSGSGHMMSNAYVVPSGSTVVPATPHALSLPPRSSVLGAGGVADAGVVQQFSQSQHSGSDGTGSHGARYSSGWNEQGVDGLLYRQTVGSGDLDQRVLSQSQNPSIGSQIPTADCSQGVPTGDLLRGSTAGSEGSGASGATGSGRNVSGGSSSQAMSTGTGSGRSQGVPALLKARSDMAVLRDLKIGPLLGRGSYGRVYKGRWKAVTVAVKIIEHMEGSPGTASSGGKKISIGREAQLATNIAHPNVVQTYQISTMTVSQRNALARAWIEEGNANSSNLNQLPPAAEAAEGGDNDSSSSNDGNDEPQKDVLETWMIMEFCEKGSLDRAVVRKRFVRKEDGLPEMIGIYKALLDTASGLDYLHSIGVVHGDLKTANVLLKGSTRDVRGFACKITDFGLSRVLDLDATHISTRTYGTIVYMPAELLLTGRMTQATDIYSFGLMMWELYTSSRVFNEGLSVGQIFYMIAYQGWRPVIPEDCPPGYAALMQACWHQDAEQRPTAQQVLRALQKLYVAEKQAAAAAKEAAAAAVGLTPFSAGTSQGGVGSGGGGGGERQQGSNSSAHAVHVSGGAGSSSGGARGCPPGTTSSDDITDNSGGPAPGAMHRLVKLTGADGSGGDSSAGSAGAAAAAQDSSGGGGPADGLVGGPGVMAGNQGLGGRQGGTLNHTESQQYQSWAQAVSRVGKQLQEDRQMDYQQLQQQQQQQQQQQLQPHRHGWQQRTGPLQSVSELGPVTGAMVTPGGVLGGYGPNFSMMQAQQPQVFGTMEVQPGDDEGPPSETLYQNDSLISNIVPDDDGDEAGHHHRGGEEDADATGYLDGASAAEQRHAVSAEPAGVLRSPMGVPQSAESTLDMYQHPQRTVGRVPPGDQSPSMQASQGLSVSSSVSGAGWGSVSTGTMPSVVGGNSSLNLSPMASSVMMSHTMGTPGGSAGTSGSGVLASGAGASPFAALAQRAGSLFGPITRP